MTQYFRISFSRAIIDNSLAHGRSECHSKNVIFNPVLLIGIFRSSHDNALRWMPQDLTDDKSILVQVMAWCRQATSHYLSQCWPRSMSPHGITRSQWVNSFRLLLYWFKCTFELHVWTTKNVLLKLVGVHIELWTPWAPFINPLRAKFSEGT